MNCNDFELVLMDIARGVPDAEGRTDAALDHAARCRRCGAVLQDQRELSRGLRTLGAGVADPPAAALETRLLARMLDEPADDAATLWRAALKVAAAVALAAAALLLAWRGVSELPPRAPEPPVAGFVLWPGAAALPPLESGELVRTELPVAVLPELGLPTPRTSGETVTADLLVAQDGLPRAVRLAN